MWQTKAVRFPTISKLEKIKSTKNTDDKPGAGDLLHVCFFYEIKSGGNSFTRARALDATVSHKDVCWLLCCLYLLALIHFFFAADPLTWGQRFLNGWLPAVAAAGSHFSV